MLHWTTTTLCLPGLQRSAGLVAGTASHVPMCRAGHAVLALVDKLRQGCPQQHDGGHDRSHAPMQPPRGTARQVDALTRALLRA